MTEEIVTASGRTDVSGVERDRAIARLYSALEAGLLTTNSYVDRLAAVLRAVASHELAALVAGLPDVPDSATDEVLYLRSDGADIRRTGRWQAPRRLRVCCSGGDVWLDFASAVISSPVVGIEFSVEGGDITLVLPAGAQASTEGVHNPSGLVACRVPAATQRPDSGLRFVVTGRQQGGNLVVRYPRRRGPSLW